jgi:hypothetical protein
MGLTAPERETNVSFNDEDCSAYVTTYNRPLLTALRANPDAKEVTSDGVRKDSGGEFIFPKKLFNIRRQTKVGAERKPRAPMSEAHKAKLAAGRAAKKMREAIEKV